MYASFFKLQRSPFEISPDPQFFFRTDAHNEALAGLYYGICGHKGFMVMTGEVGTGKTLVVRCLLQLLDQKQLNYAYMFCTRLSSGEFLQEVASDLGIAEPPRSKSQLLRQLQAYLLRRGEKGLYTALIIDEAQHLETDVLEEIRLLTNLETSRGKLLQIVLVGQPELDATLESYNLRQLKQRIAMRFQLRPLSEVQTQCYIWDRLRQAGSHDPIFSLLAIHSVHVHSGGIPRLINILCDNALISAFAAGTTEVTDVMVDGVAADLCLTERNHPRKPAPQPASGTAEVTGGDPWPGISEYDKEKTHYKSVATANPLGDPPALPGRQSEFDSSGNQQIAGFRRIEKDPSPQLPSPSSLSLGEREEGRRGDRVRGPLAVAVSPSADGQPPKSLRLCRRMIT